eukprot:TRINITY_DN7597_c0_g2_i3.p1 TRINITY_DN7597_c0_g2~~TRINITY_DN7597_c0_g2_i3.p1  ORF type:complete len:573 (-),score=113.26 TRINITY_DN7597_c0_g2_i3:13-1731(-)
MNLALLAPQTDFPEHVEEFPDVEYATCFDFNYHGEYLAFGLHDGRCFVADFETRSVSRELIAHVAPVSSVSWSRNSRKVLSSSLDWRVILWDLEVPTKEHTIRFSSIVYSAHIHPKNEYIFAASVASEGIVIYDIEKDQKTVLKFPSESEEDPATQKGQKIEASVAVFTKDGSRVIAGNTKSLLCIFSTQDGSLLYRTKLSSAPIRSLTLNRDRSLLLVNGADKIIRLYKIRNLLEGHFSTESVFQDKVNHLQWKSACFSNDSEYVLAGSSSTKERNLRVWCKSGDIYTIKDHNHEIFDLKWHPHKYIFVTCSTDGRLYIWSRIVEQNWSAFVQGFKELEENEEYIEQEDEFDKSADGIFSEKKQRLLEEDTEVDILTIERVAAFESDEEQQTYFIPPLVDVEPLDQVLLSAARPAESMGIPHSKTTRKKIPEQAAAKPSSKSKSKSKAKGGRKKKNSDRQSKNKKPLKKPRAKRRKASTESDSSDDDDYVEGKRKSNRDEKGNLSDFIDETDGDDQENIQISDDNSPQAQPGRDLHSRKRNPKEDDISDSEDSKDSDFVESRSDRKTSSRV